MWRCRRRQCAGGAAGVRFVGCRGGVVERGRDLEGKRTLGEPYNVVMVMMTELISAVVETFGMHSSSGWSADRQKP